MKEFSTSFTTEALSEFLPRFGRAFQGAPEQVEHVVREILLAPLGTGGIIHVDVGAEGGRKQVTFHYLIDNHDDIDFGIVGPPALVTAAERLWGKRVAPLEREAESKILDMKQNDRVGPTSEEWTRQVNQNLRDTAPIEAELRAAGVQGVSEGELNSIGGIDTNASTYRAAVPILLRWLPRIENLEIKEAVAEKLGRPAARELVPELARILLAEYAKLPKEPAYYREGFAQYVAWVADDQIFGEVAALLEDPGTVGRWGFVAALRKMRRHHQEATRLLLRLVHDADDVVALEAAEALANMGVLEAEPQIRRLLDRPIASHRSAARRALAKLERVRESKAPRG